MSFKENQDSGGSEQLRFIRLMSTPQHNTWLRG
jgi:hypothetical protein